MSTESDVMAAPVRRALDRGKRSLEAVLRKAGAAGLHTLQASTNEIDYLMQAVRLAIDNSGHAASASERRLHEARLRGLSRMADLRKAADPCLETGQVCQLLGVTRETIRKKVDRKQLLALPKGGDRVFPALQFKEGEVVPGLDEVLTALDCESPFVALSFLLSSSPDFGDRKAIDALQAGNVEAVVAEARAFLRHGA